MFYDPENYRFEVPTPKVPAHTAQTSDQSKREVYLYSITYDVHNQPFSIKVRRSKTDSSIFDTSVGALTFSNQFLELTTKLSSSKVFGLGQHVGKPYSRDFNWEKINLFSSKSKETQSPGVHPMYMCVEESGDAHGLLLLNSNAMEIQMHPLPAVTFRTIGGILDFYLFLGPTPEDVVQQYTEAIGYPALPPYWSLGLHVGQSSHQTAEDVEKFVDEFKSKHIPVESIILNQETVVQALHRKDKNYVGFLNLTAKLKNRNQKLIIQLGASVPKVEVARRDSVLSGNLQKDVFVTDKWGWNPIDSKDEGKVVVYPDFGSSEALSWWSTVIKKVSIIGELGGLWLVNNEPSSSSDGSTNGCLSDDLNNPPYVPGSLTSLYQHTLCMDALLHWRSDVISLYDAHNLYGHFMTIATEHALNTNYPSKRKFLISDSTFVGTGNFAGHYITGMENSWEGLRSAIPAVLKMGMHGIPLAGTKICEKSISDYTTQVEELCLRWLQCGVFFPLLHIHGDGIEYLYKAGLSNKGAIRHALSRRYELLPELYTLFYLAHKSGSSVVASLHHNFPNDNETYTIDSQFMWGSSLLISPILEKDATQLSFYLPEGLWYDYYQGSPIFSSGEWFTETGGAFEDSKQPAILHIRGGSVITLQKPAETTTISRQNSMSILVALNMTYEASGVLYWDDGETKDSDVLGEYILVNYSASGNSLVVTGNFGKKVLKSSFYKAAIEQVRIMGLRKPPKRVIIDGSYILSNKQYRWNYDTMVLDLKLILIPLGRKTVLQWFF